MAAYVTALGVARRLGRTRRVSEDGCYRFLLTGTFQSENWAGAHLRPLARSSRCASVTVVTVKPVPEIDKVLVVTPPSWLVRCIGEVPARLGTFAWAALTTQPHVIGGFHLLLNGLFAALLAPLAGARSLYFCVGGPGEVVGGGISAENRLFSKLETPDLELEQRLVQAVGSFDLIITMGAGAAHFFRQRGIRAPIHVLSGGVEDHWTPTPSPRHVSDLIYVGRLAPIKRVDLFLDVVAHVRATMPMIRATIVGDGELRARLEERVGELGLRENVMFAGQQRDVRPWLAGARVFVLTSDWEGLSLALLEAMLHGLPAVVSQIGDLGEAIEHGVNGYLVEERTPAAFANPILELLGEPERLKRFGAAAREAAQRFEVSAAVRRWDEVLGGFSKGVPAFGSLPDRRTEDELSRARGR